MLRIKCPHCGAGNQDATEQDVCWQCGKILGAPVDKSIRPPVSPGQSVPTQMLDPSLLSNLPQTTRPTKAPASDQRRILIALAVVAVLIVALLLVLLQQR